MPRLRIFETGGGRHEAGRERCDDCNSMLPIAPAAVGVYERSVDTRPANAVPASR
jgi:arginine deiminase